MPKPFLIKLARRSSGSRKDQTLAYDPVQQVSVLPDDANKRPAVTRTDIPLLTTKKADIEKGEDQKDIWPHAKSCL